MVLDQALRYPLQGKDWFRRILTLALVQLIPIAGQLILLGYGLEIVRSVYAGKTDLPPIRWLRSIRDGGLFLLTGVMYLVPLLGLIPNVAVAYVLLGFVGINLVPGSSAEIAIRMLAGVLVALIILLISIALHVGGVRYAIENKGLFDPTSNARLLLKHRATTGMLVVNVLLLSVIAIVATGVGMLLVVPGLCVFVAWIVALWYMFARYALEIGVPKPSFTIEQPVMSI